MMYRVVEKTAIGWEKIAEDGFDFDTIKEAIDCMHAMRENGGQYTVVQVSAEEKRVEENRKANAFVTNM